MHGKKLWKLWRIFCSAQQHLLLDFFYFIFHISFSSSNILGVKIKTFCIHLQGGGKVFRRFCRCSFFNFYTCWNFPSTFFNFTSLQRPRCVFISNKSLSAMQIHMKIAFFPSLHQHVSLSVIADPAKFPTFFCYLRLAPIEIKSNGCQRSRSKEKKSIKIARISVPVLKYLNYIHCVFERKCAGGERRERTRGGRNMAQIKNLIKPQ